jgi:hypothetical protein
MKSRILLSLALCCVISLTARAQPTPPPIDPKADDILKQMCKTLADAKSITFDVHNTADEILPSGQVVQVARNQKISLRRPDRCASAVIGDREEMKFAYDGKQVVMYNVQGKTWSSVDAPASVDETMDMLASKYGMALPLVDLVFSDPYKDLTARVRSGEYLGTGYVLDTKCHHLAFRQDSVDWQIWIEDGPNPVARKIVITQKEMPTRPVLTSIISNWNLKAEIPDDTFNLKPPADAKKVDFSVPAPAQPKAER